MAGIMADDDDLFTRAISGYRDAFMDERAHLPESQRNQLWGQRLSQFLPPSTTTCDNAHSAPDTGFVDHGSYSLAKSGKRTRQDTPRTIPGSGLPAPKRRATVCEILVS